MYSRIRDNVTNSPLLSLPGEIREKILTRLLGGKTIHLVLRKYTQSHYMRDHIQGFQWLPFNPQGPARVHHPYPYDLQSDWR